MQPRNFLVTVDLKDPIIEGLDEQRGRIFAKYSAIFYLKFTRYEAAIMRYISVFISVPMTDWDFRSPILLIYGGKTTWENRKLTGHPFTARTFEYSGEDKQSLICLPIWLQIWMAPLMYWSAESCQHAKAEFEGIWMLRKPLFWGCQNLCTICTRSTSSCHNVKMLCLME